MANLGSVCISSSLAYDFCLACFKDQGSQSCIQGAVNFLSECVSDPVDVDGPSDGKNLTQFSARSIRVPPVFFRHLDASNPGPDDLLMSSIL